MFVNIYIYNTIKLRLTVNKLNTGAKVLYLIDHKGTFNVIASYIAEQTGLSLILVE